MVLSRLADDGCTASRGLRKVPRYLKVDGIALEDFRVLRQPKMLEPLPDGLHRPSRSLASGSIITCLWGE